MREKKRNEQMKLRSHCSKLVLFLLFDREKQCNKSNLKTNKLNKLSLRITNKTKEQSKDVNLLQPKLPKFIL